MRVSLHPSGDYYLATFPDGTEQRLERVSHLLTEVGIGPRFGRNAQAAAEVGTKLHALAADYLRHGVVPNVDEMEVGPLLNCWVLWKDWWDNAHLSVIQVERCVACTRLGYGGMMDLLAVDDHTGELVLVDYKTSKPATSAVSKRAYQLQLAAYALALEESGHPVPSRAIIVRVGKEDEAGEVFTCWDSGEGGVAACTAWEHVCHLAFWMREQRLALEVQSEEEVFAFR